MSNIDIWATRASKLLLDRTITNVRYMTADEAEHLGWMRRAIVLELDDGNLIFPSSDDEGNDAGSMFTTADDLPTIPVV